MPHAGLCRPHLAQATSSRRPNAAVAAHPPSRLPSSRLAGCRPLPRQPAGSARGRVRHGSKPLRTAAATAGQPERAQAHPTPAPQPQVPHGPHRPQPLPIHPEIGQVLFTADELEARVAELGRLIGQDYEGKELLVVGVLKGAFMFTSDLVRRIHPHPAALEVDFLRASSYGAGTSSSGVVRLGGGFEAATAAGKHVLLVEDIIDTGGTLSALVALLEEAGAASVKVCALLDKKARRRVPLEAHYTGFACPDAFVVGYGIDYAERYRNLPYIGVPKDEFIKH